MHKILITYYFVIPSGIAQVAEATISVRRLQNFMLYEDTTKPVPGLAEIQTSTKKPTGKDKLEVKREDSKLTQETKLSPEPVNVDDNVVGFSGNGKLIVQYFLLLMVIPRIWQSWGRITSHEKYCCSQSSLNIEKSNVKI